MGFDCFCAFCGGSIVSCEIGSASEDSQRWRKTFIRRKLREIETGKYTESEEGSDGDMDVDEDGVEGGSDEGEGEDVDDGGDEDEDEVEDEDDGDDDDEEYEDDDDERPSYDPKLVTEESLEWVRSVYGLGFNPKAPGYKKTFITGPGTYDGNGGLDVNIGDDPNHPEGKDSFGCYAEYVEEDIRVIPFHWCCLELLALAITGSRNVDKVNREVLYDIIYELSWNCRDDIGLDYGDLFGRDQYWESIPGEEFSVTHPTDVPGIGGVLRNEASKDIFNNVSSTEVDLQERVSNDPFGKLPYDILHTILSFLPGKQCLALMNASWPVHSATRYKKFWKQLIYWDMPWFWELHEVIEEQKSESFNYRSFYLWLKETTAPVYGMEGPFLGIANRRRIWTPCRQLADLYHERMHRREFAADTPDSKAIIQHSYSLQTPLVLNPQPKEVPSTISKQWIYSWREVDDRSSVIEAIFNADGDLIGLGVAFGTSLRMLGSTGPSNDAGISKHSRRIKGDQWISGLVLYMSHANLLDKCPYISVCGVAVLLTSGERLRLGSCSGPARTLLVSEAKRLVGVVGQLGENGVLLRLGILECPRSRSNINPNFEFPSHCTMATCLLLRPTETGYSCDKGDLPEIPELSFSQSHLWSSHLSDIALRNPRYHVLSHPKVDPTQDEFPIDLVPQQPFIWAKEHEELSKIERISSYISRSEVPSLSSGAGSEKKPANIVLGLRAEYIRRYWEPKRYIGLPRDMNEDGDLLDWPESSLQHFDIDGPGGEYVSEVEAAIVDFPAAIKLRTNRGREVCFGEETQRSWHVLRPPQGQVIIGLALGFGRRSGYNGEAGKYTRLSLSSISALTMKG